MFERCRAAWMRGLDQHQGSSADHDVPVVLKPRFGSMPENPAVIFWNCVGHSPGILTFVKSPTAKRIYLSDDDRPFPHSA
jgi:hypothetical protein